MITNITKFQISRQYSKTYYIGCKVDFNGVLYSSLVGKKSDDNQQSENPNIETIFQNLLHRVQSGLRRCCVSDISSSLYKTRRRQL